MKMNKVKGLLSLLIGREYNCWKKKEIEKEEIFSLRV